MNQLVGILQHFYNSALRKNKHEWEIILYCVGTAALFWILNAMGKTYHHTLKIPLEYHYQKDSYLPLESLPKNLDVLVEGRGWDLTRAIWAWRKDPITISFDKPREIGYLLPGKWKEQAIKILPEVKVEAILMDTIFCRFDRIEKKRVELYVDLKEIRVKNGYQITSPIRITPKYVEFRGAASRIRNLPAMLPVKIESRDIKETFDQNVPLDFSEDFPNDELLSHNLDAINVQFTVRPSLEEEMEVPVLLKNGNLKPKLFLKERKVLLSFLVSDADRKKLKPADFKVVADMSTFNSADSTVEVRLESKPKMVSDVQVPIRKTKVYGQ